MAESSPTEKPKRKRKPETRPEKLAWMAAHGHKKKKFIDPEIYAHRETPAEQPPAVPEEPKGPAETYGIAAAEEAASFAAADALQRAGGDVDFALRYLGYPVDKMAKPEIRMLAMRVFDPTVVERLNERLANLQAKRTELLARQVRIALHGDTEDSMRAFAGLARIAGWNAAIKVKAETSSVNIHHIMSNPELLTEALSHFSHEPGAPKPLGDARAKELPAEVEAAIAELEDIEGETVDDE